MQPSPFNASSARLRSSIARKLFTSFACMIIYSGMSGLIVQQLSQRCLLSCLVSIALAWASHVAAFGERPLDRDPVQAKASAQITALMGRVNARTGEPIEGAMVSLEEFDRHRHASTLSSSGGSFQFASVPAGEYRLEISAPGYRTFVVARRFTDQYAGNMHDLGTNTMADWQHQFRPCRRWMFKPEMSVGTSRTPA